MSAWRSDIGAALEDFATVARLARLPIQPADLQTEYCDAAHRPPSSLPMGKMAIYGFWWGGTWLKIGKAGPQSQARYTSQHYNPNSAPSTLAASLLRDARMASLAGFDVNRPGDWIKTSCCRVNILLPMKYGKPALALLEAFLHARLYPRYEG